MKQVMADIAAVALGGGLGATLRYGTCLLTMNVERFKAFPAGTALVNVIGCFAIGLLGGWIESQQSFHHGWRLFLIVGVLGGFTTFSAFGFETVGLLRDGRLLAGFVHVALHLVLALFAVGVGFALTYRS